jgi:hypothetical protein
VGGSHSDDTAKCYPLKVEIHRPRESETYGQGDDEKPFRGNRRLSICVLPAPVLAAISSHASPNGLQPDDDLAAMSFEEFLVAP